MAVNGEHEAITKEMEMWCDVLFCTFVNIVLNANLLKILFWFLIKLQTRWIVIRV